MSTTYTQVYVQWHTHNARIRANGYINAIFTAESPIVDMIFSPRQLEDTHQHTLI